MIIISVTPKEYDNLYGELVKKERALRGRGVFYRSTSKRFNYEKWSHERYKGWIWFQRCLGGGVTAEIQTRDPESQWQILTAFVGFLDRHFKTKIASINISYLEE